MSRDLPEATTGDVIDALRRNVGKLRGGTEYSNWRDEQLSWKETCFLGDWSLMPDLHVEGPDTIDLFSDLSVNSFADFEVGTAKQAILCNEEGYIIGDGVLRREAEDKVAIQNVATWPIYNIEHGDYDVTAEIRDSFIYQVQGPNAMAVLESVTDDDLRDVAFLNFTKITINDIPVTAIRMGMSGEIGFELHGSMADGDEIYQTLLAAGQEHGIRQLGSKTRHQNMIEMAFPIPGYEYLPAIYGEEMRPYREWLLDFDEGRAHTDWNTWNIDYAIEGSYDSDDLTDWYRTPVDLGWEHIISFDHDFVGRTALETAVEDPTGTLVTLVWDRDDVSEVYASMLSPGDHYKYMELPFKQERVVVADEVVSDGQVIGMSTGRAYSYYFREMLSLCTIDPAYSTPGTEVTIRWGEGGDPPSPSVEAHVQKEITAEVAPAPYYQEDNRRVDLDDALAT